MESSTYKTLLAVIIILLAFLAIVLLMQARRKLPTALKLARRAVLRNVPEEEWCDETCEEIDRNHGAMNVCDYDYCMGMELYREQCACEIALKPCIAERNILRGINEELTAAYADCSSTRPTHSECQGLELSTMCKLVTGHNLSLIHI